MRAALDFARPAYRDPRWVEAVEVAAVTTRDRLHFQLVAEFATNLDVAHTRVVVHAGDAASPVDLDFSDVQFNLPIGTSRLSGVSLASGVVMRTSVPHKEYELEYLSACGRVEARMEMTAVTAPVTGDVTRQESGDVRGSADVEPDDDARPGRIDQLVSVRGDLRVDDSFYTMDCLANRAHRWGSVPDVLPTPVGVDEIHFGEHLSVLVDAVQERPGWLTVRHAYVVRKGELRRVSSASVVYEGEQGAGGYRALRYELTDETGEMHRIAATVASTSVLDCGQNRRAELRRLDAAWNEYTGHGRSVWHSDMRDLQRERRGSRRAKARTQERRPA